AGLPVGLAGVAGEPDLRPGAGACPEERAEAAGGVACGLLEGNRTDLVEELVALSPLQLRGRRFLGGTQPQRCSLVVGLPHDGDEVVADNASAAEQPGEVFLLLSGGV